MDAKAQSAVDRATIKVKLIANGILVSCGDGWFTFKSWDEAASHMKHRLDSLMDERIESEMLAGHVVHTERWI